MTEHITLELTSTVLAQAPPPRSTSGGSVAVRSYTVEWVIVGVFVAAALYAVCRPSRRS